MRDVFAESVFEKLPAHLRVEDLIAVVGSLDGAAILESGPGFGHAGRWTILAAPPSSVFEATGTQWTISDPAGSAIETGDADPLGRLGSWIESLGLHATTQPSFRGGLLGFYGYDLAPQLEKLTREADHDSTIPDIRFGLHDLGITVDHQTGEIIAWETKFPGIRPGERLSRFRNRLTAKASQVAKRSNLSQPIGETTRPDFERGVQKALDYIAAGDIFQVNLSQRFSAWGEVDPLDLYLRLRTRSPSPYSAFLRWGDKAVISASPELFFETHGRRIVTRPIKGTRPRGRSEEEDSRLKEELRASTKDRAELTMIVDLERNDLGRICRYGSVRVEDASEIETFAQVHHLVATIVGELRPEITPIDVVRAMFPGGSITGAPKIRSMEIIDELEPNRRNLYTGAIGYYGYGTSCFNIVIRTILVDGDHVSYQVGGGIVADSTPSKEFEETMHKGRALFAILNREGDA